MHTSERGGRGKTPFTTSDPIQLSVSPPPILLFWIINPSSSLLGISGHISTSYPNRKPLALQAPYSSYRRDRCETTASSHTFPPPCLVAAEKHHGPPAAPGANRENLAGVSLWPALLKLEYSLNMHQCFCWYSKDIGLSWIKGTSLTTSSRTSTLGRYDATSSYVHAKLLQSCLSLCDPTDCSPTGSSVQGILQARIL